MEKGKLIVIEGTDCSGKETQSKKLIEKLNKEGVKTEYFSFPNYNSPTGKMIGLPYLGKEYLAEELINQYRVEILNRLNVKRRNINERVLVQMVLDEIVKSLTTGWFKEGAPQVDPLVSSLFYAADRRYNLPIIESKLDEGINVVIDRYTYSNMGHQGGKITDWESRKAFYEWAAYLEFEMLGLPKSDVRIFLYLPTGYAALLKQKRQESLDEHEADGQHLRNAENAYIEIAYLFDFKLIKCVEKNSPAPKIEEIKSVDEINHEVYSVVKKELRLN